MTVLAGLSARGGEVAEDGSSKTVGAATELYRTYDGKSMNLQPRRIAARPPLPRRRPVSLPGRDLADAATLSGGKPGTGPVGKPEAAMHSTQVKNELDATASYDGGRETHVGTEAGSEAMASRAKVNFKAKY